MNKVPVQQLEKRYGWYRVDCLVKTSIFSSDLITFEVVSTDIFNSGKKIEAFLEKIEPKKAGEILPNHIFAIWQYNKKSILAGHSEFVREVEEGEDTTQIVIESSESRVISENGECNFNPV